MEEIQGPPNVIVEEAQFSHQILCNHDKKVWRIPVQIKKSRAARPIRGGLYLADLVIILAFLGS